MAELEIHHEVEAEHDPTGQRVGVLAAVLAVLLAVVTIASHRTHTDAILEKSAANDSWQHYQSVRVKFHTLELGEDLTRTLAPKSESLSRYQKDMAKYEEQAQEIQAEAKKQESEAASAENRALHYDLGEGLLEIALVLSSLYFISRKKMFPVLGVIGGVAGVLVALTGLMV
jgi:uncharacterized protein DUF4337